MRPLHSLSLGLLFFALAPPVAAHDSDKDHHHEWINLLSVSHSITRPMGGGASNTPGARVQFATPGDFIQRVEAGRMRGAGQVVLVVEARSTAHRALGRSRYESLDFKTPSGRPFSLRGATLSGRARGSAAAETPVEEITLKYEKITWSY